MTYVIACYASVQVIKVNLCGYIRQIFYVTRNQTSQNDYFDVTMTYSTMNFIYLFDQKAFYRTDFVISCLGTIFDWILYLIAFPKTKQDEIYLLTLIKYQNNINAFVNEAFYQSFRFPLPDIQMKKSFFKNIKC